MNSHGKIIPFPTERRPNDPYRQVCEDLWVAVANGYQNDALKEFVEGLPEDELKHALKRLLLVVGEQSYMP